MEAPLRLTLDRYATPVGEALVVTDDDGALRALDFFDYEARMHDLMRRQYGAGRFVLTAGRMSAGVREALDRYFAGEITAVDDLRTVATGQPFQLLVWKALRGIAAGTTTSYGAIAKAIGQPGAARAVGLANGSNPIAIVVPCHRVIGASGALTGYGGGLPRKQWLLEHEGAIAKAQARLL